MFGNIVNLIACLKIEITFLSSITKNVNFAKLPPAVGKQVLSKSRSAPRVLLASRVKLVGDRAEPGREPARPGALTTETTCTTHTYLTCLHCSHYLLHLTSLTVLAHVPSHTYQSINQSIYSTCTRTLVTIYM